MMSDDRSIESTSSKEAETAPRRSRWQFSLRMILLLTAAVGVWTAEIANRYEIQSLEKRINAMRPLARELIINDRNQIAVVKLEEHWYDANEWRVYLPPGEYQLRLATQDIPSQGFPSPQQTALLKSGEFELSIMQKKQTDGHRVQVLKDGAVFMTADEPKNWDPGVGSSGGGQFSNSVQLKPSEPVVLFRRRFSQPAGKGSSTTPMEPCAGVMLWIEPIAKNPK
jgi:hypothetical protein